MNENMLMFSKIYLAVLYAIDVFAFHVDDTIDIFSKLDIVKCFPYIFLTVTDSASFQLAFICKVDCSITED